MTFDPRVFVSTPADKSGQIYVVIRLLNRTKEPSSRLICFSYAGGSGSEYYDWKKHLAPDVDIGIVNLKGRGARYGEQPETKLENVLSEVVSSLRPLSNVDYSFFGHSLGCLIAFEACHRLRDEGIRMPQALFMSARRAPHLPLRRERLYTLSDKNLMREVKRLGSVNSHLLENAELMKMVLPVLRSDFMLNDDYSFPQRTKLDIPIVLFGGRSDDSAREDELQQWSSLTTEPTELHMFEGGHFYIEQNLEQINQIVNQKISCAPA